MKLNFANPATGAMKCIDIDDEKTLSALYDKRMAQEIEGDFLGDEYKGYVFRITGGNDKEGFPMMQGVLINHRVRLLLSKNSPAYRPRRSGERKRKSVRGCIIGPDIAVLNMIVVKKGDSDIPGLTDPESERPRRLGPKRANHIRKLYNLSKDDDVRKFVVTREFERKGRMQQKRPKIQRLITPRTLHHKRRLIAAKRAQREKARRQEQEYERLRKQRLEERKESIAKRKSSRKSSRKEA